MSDWDPTYTAAVELVYSTYAEYQRQCSGDTSRGRVLVTKKREAEEAWVQAVLERSRVAGELFPDEPPSKVLMRYLRNTVVNRKVKR